MCRGAPHRHRRAGVAVAVAVAGAALGRGRGRAGRVAGGRHAQAQRARRRHGRAATRSCGSPRGRHAHRRGGRRAARADRGAHRGCCSCAGWREGGAFARWASATRACAPLSFDTGLAWGRRRAGMMQDRGADTALCVLRRSSAPAGNKAARDERGRSCWRFRWPAATSQPLSAPSAARAGGYAAAPAVAASPAPLCAAGAEPGAVEAGVDPVLCVFFPKMRSQFAAAACASRHVSRSLGRRVSRAQSGQGSCTLRRGTAAARCAVHRPTQHAPCCIPSPRRRA